MVSQSSSSVLCQKDSIFDIELNDILEKVNKGERLTEKEISFMKDFQTYNVNDYLDLSHLSKNQTFEKVTKLLQNSKKIICDLRDKDGKIDEEIVSIENIFDEEYCILHLKNGSKMNLYDRFLYRIIYNFKKQEYHLDSTGEYYEKIFNNNED